MDRRYSSANETEVHITHCNHPRLGPHARAALLLLFSHVLVIYHVTLVVGEGTAGGGARWRHVKGMILRHQVRSAFSCIFVSSQVEVSP